MSKFIRVTDKNTGIITMQNTSTVEFFGDQIMVCKDGSSMDIKESIDQIEAQLLRDEFAKAFVSASDPTDYHEFKHLASDAYMFADAMIKERLK